MHTINIPFFKAKVRKEYLYNLEKHFNEYEDCYVIAVTIILNRPLLFHVHTKRGAVYSKLPIEAICSKDTSSVDIQNWNALGNRASVVSIDYLKNYDVKTKHGLGMYMFSIDFFDGGFSEDPEQQKILHLIQLENGNYATAPNNECLFEDAHFTETSKVDYKRNTNYWRGSE